MSHETERAERLGRSLLPILARDAKSCDQPAEYYSAMVGMIGRSICENLGTDFALLIFQQALQCSSERLKREAH